MKQYIIPTAALLMVGSTTLFATITYFGYITGTALLPEGSFHSDGTTGNAGTVTMLSTARIDGVSLIGEFVTEAAGTGRFMPGARIVPPATGSPTRTCWTVDGIASGTNMGVISLSGPNTALRFNPVSRNLEGYGYNDGLGRVPLGRGTTCEDGIVDNTEVAEIQNGTDTTNTISTSSAGFVGRVKIIGNAGGTTVFDTFYSQGVKFNASLFNTTLQRIRKNVGLLIRNLGANQKNGTNLVGDKMFLIDQPMKLTSTIPNLNDIRSIIIVGGDLYINQDFTGATMNNPKGIIVLKNNNGAGGNIYIDENVKNISAVIFAEGTVYSGESATVIYNDTPDEIADPKPNQLYILGAVISRNTIGGASRLDILCPYNEACTLDSATKYDLNYFRGFQSGSLADRAYPNATLDDYSLIIETDRGAIANPPPGFE